MFGIGRWLLNYLNSSQLILWVPKDDTRLPDELINLFELVCDTSIERYTHGRVILGSRLIALYRVDPQWTERILIPLFGWSNFEVALSVWSGYLHAPRLYAPLLAVIRIEFLDCARHYHNIGQYGRQYVSLLTQLALSNSNEITHEELSQAFSILPPKGIEDAVEVLIRVIESTSESSDDVWKNRVPPLIKLILGGVDNATSSLSESLARLIITSGSQFANALNQVKHWLSIVDQPYRIIRKMNENGICRDFPLESLTLLKLIIPKVLMPATYLGSCLDMIRSADGTLVEDDRFVDLELLVDRFS